jgi:hypothetical protein
MSGRTTDGSNLNPRVLPLADAHLIPPDRYCQVHARPSADQPLALLHVSASAWKQFHPSRRGQLRYEQIVLTPSL